MPTELESDVASPLARFCPKTRWLFITVFIVLTAEIGSVFALLLRHHDQSNEPFGVLQLLPLGLTIGASILSYFAYRVEKQAGLGESNSAKSLLWVMLSIFIFLLFFFYFILLV